MLFTQGRSFDLKFEPAVVIFVSMMALHPKEVTLQFADSYHRNIKPTTLPPPKLDQN